MDKVTKAWKGKGDRLNQKYNLSSPPRMDGGTHDPRIVALVRFLARRAAEEDYKELLQTVEDRAMKEEAQED